MKKSTPNPRKSEQVLDLTSRMEKSKAVFLTDYRGLTHKQLEDIRKTLKKVEAEYVVVKNTLLKKALESAKKDSQELLNTLKDSTAALFAYGDSLSAVKKLWEFSKNFTFLKVKIGLMDNIITSPEDFNRLATLPDKNTLLATLVYRLNTPLYALRYALNWNLLKLAVTLNNIKAKKTG